MAGLEILGGIASAVQLATTCYQLQNRVRMRSGDRSLSATIHAECEVLIDDINKHILSLSSDSRLAAQHLLDRLTEIKSRIEKRSTRKRIVKGITVLRLYGGTDKDDLLVALQEYQSRAAMISSAAVDTVLRNSNGRMAPELEGSLRSITGALTTLGYNMTQTENQIQCISRTIKGVDGKMDATMTQVAEIRSTVERSNDRFGNLKATVQDAMKEELACFRTSLCGLGLFNPLSQVDRSDLALDFGSMKTYLQSIVQGKAWPSDLEIWECIWDVVQTVHMFGPAVGELTTSALEGIGAVATEVSGGTSVVRFSPIMGPLWNSLGVLSHFVLVLIRVLGLYKRYPQIQGTRRFTWKLQVLLQHLYSP